MPALRAAHVGAVAAAVAIVGIATSVIGQDRSQAQTKAPTQPQAQAQPLEPTGRLVYLRDCAVCHGADAGGTANGPDLHGVGAAAVDFWVGTGRMPLVAQPARAPSDRILKPVPENQLGDPSAAPLRHTPAYRPEVIASVVAYVSSIAPGGPGMPNLSLAGADTARGGETYRLECAACHSWAATGGGLYQRAAPSLAPATPVQIAEAVRTGPDQMPSFGAAAIPDAQLADLVAYVRAIVHADDRGGEPLWHLGPVAEGAVAVVGAMGLVLLVIRWIGERS